MYLEATTLGSNFAPLNSLGEMGLRVSNRSN